jgi:diguanylate cyclase (GGDEF)-like protein
MDAGLLNVSMVKVSILTLFIICLILVGLVFVLAVSLWNMRAKFKDLASKNILHPANKHHLTGLDNRPTLIHVLENLLVNGKVNELNTALLFIDIDDFNSINGSLGVKLGDMLLQNVGSRIVAEVSGYSKYVYQVGSDEFVVLLYDYGQDTSSIAEIANNIIRAVAQPINLQGYDLQISCCVGVCTYPECASDAETLLKNAGSARDNAKKIGYGSCSFYTQEMSKKSVIRTLISADLRQALERNEFYLHYQPKIELATGKVQGAEALLRWRHPSLGNITPDIFVPVMEDLGLIHTVGKWVIQTACKEISKLHKDGYSSLNIAINLSPHQFDKGDIASIIAEVIWDTGIAPHKVEIELTEAVVMSDTEKSVLMLRVLQSMGVKIAVDDFGTGYSSMNQLTRFPINILKVDRCFIHDMHVIPANRAIVSTIIRMAKQLGYEVVAEGVECVEELELLRAEGCDLIQGFYFSKPLSFADFSKYVREINVVTNDSNQQKKLG